MRKTRTSDDRTARPAKKLDLRRETLRRLDSLSDADLQRAAGGQRTGLTRMPSVVVTTGPNTGC
jgi:hypothetical protein